MSENVIKLATMSTAELTMRRDILDMLKNADEDFVLDIIHSLTSSILDRRKSNKAKLCQKDNDPVLEKLLSDFEKLKEDYPDNWDEEGAVAITQAVSDNYKAVLRKGSGLIVDKWWLAPMPNGTVVLISNKKHSNIQIGDSTISYFITHNKEYEGESSIDFSVDKVLEIIRKANEVC